MRLPQLYDCIYHAQIKDSVFRVIGINHDPAKPQPTYSLIGLPTLKHQTLAALHNVELHHLHGIPFKDIPELFEEGTFWKDNYVDDEDGDVWVGIDVSDFSIEWDDQENKYCFSEDYEPEPEDVEYLHELQQLKRALSGMEIEIKSPSLGLKM